jgi:hypothetical protein
MYFDRALYPAEQLQVYYQEGKDIRVNSLAADNTLEITGLTSGVYPLQVAGFYNGHNTFSDGPLHKDTIVLTDPEPVAVSDVSLRPVSCYGGNDGTVKVTAKGGVGGYRLYWLQTGEDEDYWDIPFATSQDTVYYVDNLYKGRYEFYLSDANGCYEKKLPGEDGSDIQKHTREITAPAQPLQVVSKEVENPKGYQRTDGYISIQLTGGTPLPNGMYHVTWKDAQGNTLRSTEEIPPGEPFTTTLPSRGDGTYTVEITDANYAGAYASCNTHCVIRDTITLVEPPELIVSLRETKYVSCWSWADGAITATAEGGVPLTGAFPYHYRWFRMEGDVAVDMTTQRNDSIYAGLPSGYYKVKATDTYGNEGISEVFFLEEPTALKIQACGSSIRCNGESTGTVKVEAWNATPPYLYSWSTGATTDSLENLLVGKYWVKVTDSRGCYRDTTVAVASPDQLVIAHTAVNPICYQTPTGSIEMNVSGGEQPYAYLWNTGQQTGNLSQLMAGDYSLTVTDRNGCSMYESIRLTDPLPVSVDAGPDRTLCRDQSVTLAPVAEDPNAVFEWKNEQGVFDVSPEVTLNQAGKYTLILTDSKGCMAKDTVEIKVNDVEISSELVVASAVFRNDTILFVNISSPEPESSEWLIEPHPDMRIVEQTGHTVRVIFSENGQYTLGCRSHVGDCYQDAYKTVTVVDAEEFYSAETFDQTLIRNFSIHPNPNSGIFSAIVELERDAPVRLRLLNLTTGQLMSDIRLSGDKEYTVPYNLQLAAGTYALALETAAGRMVVKVLTN